MRKQNNLSNTQRQRQRSATMIVRRRIAPLLLLLLVTSAVVIAGVSYGDLVDEFDRGIVGKLARSTLDRLLFNDDANNNAEEGVNDNGTETTNNASDQESPASSSSPQQMNDVDPNINYHGEDLIEWIMNNGGLIHSNARIGLDPTGRYRGVFVKNVDNEGGTAIGIEEGDIIARIPYDLIIKPKNYKEHSYWNCDAVHELYHQFQLGNDSPYAPYVNYLMNQPRGRIPSEWTLAGKTLLYTILDRREEDDEGLPPLHHKKGYEDTWLGECHGEDTELAKAAFYQFTSRDEDTLMVPFYDMCNHSNDPMKLNTISVKPNQQGKPFILRSIRDITPGEQIYISYNRCHRCWFDKTYEDCVNYSYYGTSDVFDIFGFVEDFPQTWKFIMNIGDEDTPKWDELSFCLGRDTTGESELVVSFGDNHSRNPEDEAPNMSTIVYLGKQLTRLAELEETMKKDDKLMTSMPKYEWEMAWTYHQALMTAISAALLASGLVEYDNDELVQNENERVIDSDSDDDDDDEDGDNEEESEDDGEVFEFVELDVGEAAMPTAEFTAELMDSSDDDSEDSDDDDDDSSDDYEVVEIVPPLENERDEL